jgi:beta-glucosidase
VTDSTSFPQQFVWGAATAAYQIEGAATADGRGESIWDRFCALPGKVRNGDSGAVACDFYHRYPADVALMRELGLDAFRFSISWPRILPEGRGRVNQAGLDFYDRVVDELLSAGIQPFPTLYHWDLPQALEDEGGWTTRSVVDAFLEYVDAVAARLGDRVRHWTTLNEPWVAAWLGYGWGQHAPGRTSDADALAASHHLLLAHGRAVELLRRLPGARLGIALSLIHVDPASDAEDDVRAARELDGRLNRWYLDPIFRSAYPADLLEVLEPDLPEIAAGDLEAAGAPIDFLGVNYYTRFVARAGADGEGPVIVPTAEGERTDMGWEVYPDGLFELLVRLRSDYAVPSVHVTENGAAYGDLRGHDGAVRDPERQAYIAGHLAAVERAIDAGAPVHGYFVWSLLDNFEWSFGYSKRFGLVYVDYPTLERVPKASYGWYRDFIAAQRNGAREWRASA